MRVLYIVLFYVVPDQNMMPPRSCLECPDMDDKMDGNYYQHKKGHMAEASEPPLPTWLPLVEVILLSMGKFCPPPQQGLV